MYDADFAAGKNVQKYQCPNCEAAEAVLAAYRHALKDIARGGPEKARRLAELALDDQRMHRLGKSFHMIVKWAFKVRVTGGPEHPDFPEMWKKLLEVTEDLWTHPEATVKGWQGERV